MLKVHVIASVLALWSGGLLLILPKGRRCHRMGGWIWATLLALAAASSLFVTTVSPGRWSIVHILSVITLIVLPAALWAARRHKVKTHLAVMSALFLVALVSEAASAFLPGRMFNAMFVN